MKTEHSARSRRSPKSGSLHSELQSGARLQPPDKTAGQQVARFSSNSSGGEPIYVARHRLHKTNSRSIATTGRRHEYTYAGSCSGTMEIEPHDRRFKGGLGIGQPTTTQEAAVHCIQDRSNCKSTAHILQVKALLFKRATCFRRTWLFTSNTLPGGCRATNHKRSITSMQRWYISRKCGDGSVLNRFPSNISYTHNGHTRVRKERYLNLNPSLTEP